MQSKRITPPPTDPRRSDADVTHSFILRVRIERTADGLSAQSHFRLEDVSERREWRFTSYRSAAECLEGRVREILAGVGLA